MATVEAVYDQVVGEYVMVLGVDTIKQEVPALNGGRRLEDQRSYLTPLAFTRAPIGLVRQDIHEDELEGTVAELVREHRAKGWHFHMLFHPIGGRVIASKLAGPAFVRMVAGVGSQE